MVKGTNSLPVQETEQDPDIMDNEYKERVMTNYAAKSEDYEPFADKNVTTEYRYRYREMTEKNRKDGISYWKVPAKSTRKGRGAGMKKRCLEVAQEAIPVTKLLSIVVHKLSQREIDLAMNSRMQTNVIQDLKFIDHL